MKNNVNGKKSILITGITGFLGSSLARFFLLQGYSIIGLKRSFSNEKNLLDFIDNSRLHLYNIDELSLKEIYYKHTINIIINSATSSSNRGGDICQIMEANVVLPLNLLELAYKNNCEQFINAGVFIPNEYIDTYYHSKKIFIECMQEYSKYITIIDIQLQMIYGENSSNTQFISKVISNFLGNIKYMNLTAGLQERDFIYIDDTVNAFNTIIQNIDTFSQGYTEVGLGNGSPVTIKYLIEKLKNLTQNNTTKLNFGSVEYRKNEIMSSQADIRLLESLGWKPMISIEDGLKMTVDGLKMNSKYD